MAAWKDSEWVISMTDVLTGPRFVLFYATFLCFFLFIMGMGGAQYVASGMQCNSTLNITSNCLNTTALVPPAPPSGFLGTLSYVADNIGLLFILMVVNPFAPSVAILWILVGIPAVITLVYLVLLLIRGGGG
jgi:hypothetical protein